MVPGRAEHAAGQPITSQFDRRSSLTVTAASTTPAPLTPAIDRQSAMLIGYWCDDLPDSLEAEEMLRLRAQRHRVDLSTWPAAMRSVALHLFMAGMDEQRLRANLAADLTRSATA
jgi:hypothetical protein